MPGVRTCRVLVVEDNQDTADSLKMLLELWGYEARVAYTGPEGVRLAEDWGPDVVLSDIGLPGLDGFDLARALRHNSRTAGVKLVAITAYGSEQTRLQAAADGFDHFLTKPANPSGIFHLLADLAHSREDPTES